MLKKEFKKYILILVHLLAVPFFTISAVELNELESIKKRGELRVGTLYGQTSYYIGANGPMGFEYEIANEFAQYLGVNLTVIPNYHISELFPKLEANHVDLLAGGFTVTPERKKKFRFSPSYTSVSQKIVFKQGKKRPRTPEALTGTLLVTEGSSHAELLKELQLEKPELKWQETSEQDSDELIQAVLNEEIDYTVVDSNNLAINRRYYPDISVAFSISDQMPNSWVLNKNTDDSLYSVMIEFFGEIHQNGKLKTIEDKYFGHVSKFNYVDTRLFIKAAKKTLPKYKALFKQHSEDLDWRLIAAQSYQESHWDPRARSRTGVRGIMMLTLPTAKQMGVTSRLDAAQNIKGGSKYLNKLVRRIPDRIQQPDRLWFAMAAYNVGWGHVEDARIITQRQGGNPDKWIDVKERLPLLRQKKFYKKTKYGYARGNEAIAYVANIRRYYDSLVWLDEQEQLEIQQQQLEDNLINTLEEERAEDNQAQGEEVFEEDEKATEPEEPDKSNK